MFVNTNSLDQLFSLIDKVCYSPKDTELLVAGADHGIAKEGISRFSFGQTLSILKISASIHSPVSRICKNLGIKPTFFNVGCAEKRSYSEICDNYYISAGTEHIGKNVAIEESKLMNILELADLYVRNTPAKQFCLGEVGVGNTLSSSAIVSLICGVNVRKVTGNGSGISHVELKKKRFLIECALNRHKNSIQKSDPLKILGSLGGIEIAWNVGVILAAYKYNKVVLLDGFITGVSALIAFLCCENVIKQLVVTHLSREPGHKYLLDFIGLKPFLNLDMALGQGFGAALGFSFILNSSTILGKK